MSMARVEGIELFVVLIIAPFPCHIELNVDTEHPGILVTLMNARSTHQMVVIWPRHGRTLIGDVVAPRKHHHVSLPFGCSVTLSASKAREKGE